MNWKRAVVAALFSVPVIVFLAWGLTRDPREIPSPLPGRAAPPFALAVFAPGEGALARLVGDSVRLAELRGRGVVLNFWASWCLACQDEHEALSSVARAYADRPVTFVGVLYNDMAAAGLEWIRRMGGQSYPSVTDPASRTAIEYGLYGVPETFFIDAAGRVAYKQTGPVTAHLLRARIDSLLAAIPPAAAADRADSGEARSVTRPSR
jgi:cytochrome c biogenesis protein CcmG/thiol:disulfide interchange protein DsbE